ncbi:aldehyde dehydrogenase family protein [Actinophytocola oryzae]|uniref:Acyl-CoA reductase-like NAD-dependent aldehyde dehydrogenase n=1 Tax=Actinophytocola oryzae TaxID=502181 RepID=A0A4R7VS27_9PSEU|nr:aldehyde dehydrogenase family protein [Actinophytocola oryzae]TDV52027.1 acyl-CoA reductase-like NAD-dependent aldehyde dehydrogenase [Actinophytocola oryzae]
MLDLDALGPNGPYRTRNRLPLTDVAGAPLGELSLVPPLFITRTMAALRRARPLPVAERTAAIARAGELFATGEVGGMSAAEYQHTVSRMSGTPLPVVRQAVDTITRHATAAYDDGLQSARPVGAVNDLRDQRVRQGAAAWIRKGEVFAVHAAGNSPGVHAGWLEALAAGYRVAVRPSGREPLTPHRLISALHASGFGTDQVVLLPTDHAAAGEILRGADLSMVYGGQYVIDKYATDPTVLPNGPGRSKILLTSDSDWRDHVDMVVDSVSALGGAACVNTTAVFVEGDPGPVAAAIAERLAAIPSLPPEDDKAVLPAYPREAARSIEAYLLAKASGVKAHLGGDGVVDEVGDAAVLRPAVFELPDPHAAQAGIELGFPCVWVAPWTREAGVVPLRNSLVLTAVTSDETLLDELLDEPTIRNLYVGDRPTHWMAPGVPHDGYLGEFLMRSKGVVRH